MTERLDIPCRSTQCDWLDASSMRCLLTVPRGRGEESWVLALADCPMARLLARGTGGSDIAEARRHVAVLHAIDTADDNGRLLPEAANLLRASEGDVEKAHARGGRTLQAILLALEATHQAQIRRRSLIHRGGGPVAAAAIATAAALLFLWGLSLLLQPARPRPAEPLIRSIAWVEEGASETGRRHLEIAFVGDVHPIVTMVLTGGRVVRLYPPPNARPAAKRPEHGSRTWRLPEEGPGWALPPSAVLVVVSDEASTPRDLASRIAAIPLLPVHVEAEFRGVRAIAVGASTP